MPNEDLETIMANRMNRGDTTRDEVLKEELIRQLLYTESGSLSVGTEIIGTQTMDQRAVEFAYPGEMSAEYPVSMDTVADRQRLTWDEFSIRLHRANVRYGISDGAKLEGMGDIQMDRTRRRASEALARRKDENILGTLAGGAFSENDKESGTWITDEEAADGEVNMVDALWSMWKDIVVNAPVNTMDTFDMAVVLPAEVYVEINKLELINNIQQRMRDYLGQAFGFSIYPTKVGYHDDDQPEKYDGPDSTDHWEPQDTAIMIQSGSDTALHGELSASTASARGVPLVEQERQFGKGEQYIVSQWFNTAVMEHESGEEGASPRISVRTGINGNA